jgi:CRP-like cAMP-binding protein
VRKVLFIFSVLGDGDVEWLASAGERVHVDPGTVLVPLGSHVDYVYFVLEGRLAIKTRTGDVIANLESGEIIGEMSLVDPAPTAVAVEVVADSTLLRIADGSCAKSSPAIQRSPLASIAHSASSWPIACARRRRAWATARSPMTSMRRTS